MFFFCRNEVLYLYYLSFTSLVQHRDMESDCGFAKVYYMVEAGRYVVAIYGYMHVFLVKRP